MGGEFGPSHAHVFLSLSDLKQNKQELRKFSDDTENHIEVFRELVQTYELIWKDVMLLLNETLSSNERQVVVMQAVITFRDEYYIVNFRRCRRQFE